MNVPTTKVFQLGKTKTNNKQPWYRPLLVALENENNKATLIALSSQLQQHDKYENIYIVLIKLDSRGLNTKAWLIK